MKWQLPQYTTVFFFPLHPIVQFCKRELLGLGILEKGEKKVDTAHRKNFILLFLFVPVYFLPSDCSIDAVPRSLGPTGLGKNINNTQNNSSQSDVHIAFDLPCSFVSPYSFYVYIQFSSLCCSFPVLMRYWYCVLWVIPTSELPHFSGIKVRHCCNVLCSCFVGKAFSGNIYIVGVLRNVRLEIIILAWADGKWGDFSFTFHPVQGKFFRFNTQVKWAQTQLECVSHSASPLPPPKNRIHRT